MTDPGSFARDAAEAEGARRERERLLTALAEELSRYAPTDTTAVVIDNLWGFVAWQRARGRV